MDMSSSPFAAQSAALTAVLATVTALVNELGRTKAIDPLLFGATLDSLLSRSTEPTEVGNQVKAAIGSMMKEAAHGGREV